MERVACLQDPAELNDDLDRLLVVLPQREITQITVTQHTTHKHTKNGRREYTKARTAAASIQTRERLGRGWRYAEEQGREQRREQSRKN